MKIVFIGGKIEFLTGNLGGNNVEIGRLKLENL